ncbi:MAG: DinB family protein [Gemmatimonadaceae bacterium]
MHSPDVVIEALARAPEIVVPLVREVPPAILKRRPAPSRWSAHEHACHLAHVHALFFERLDLMLREPEPFIGGYQPGERDADDMLLRMDLEDSLASYVADRTRLVTRLRALDEADWARSARHGEYRAYSVFIMFRHVALHDFLHGYRIEELLLRPDWDAGHAAAGPLA